MVSVQTGASRAIDECKFQFRTRRWNCSTLDDDQASGGNGKLPTSIVPLQPPSKNKKKSKGKKKKEAIIFFQDARPVIEGLEPQQ